MSKKLLGRISFAFLAAAGALSACSTTGRHARNLAEAPAEPITWVELGPDSAVIARVITGAAQCPEISVDDKTSAMSERAAPTDLFPGRVCEATLQKSAHRASIGGQTLRLPVADPQKILFIGDTGCRIKVKADGYSDVQDCNDPERWPFATLAQKAMAIEPDLIVHLGDYHYRESACPAGSPGCKDSPSGKGWEAWNADFFEPAKPLLKAAPWIFVRGNHELCSRAGEGWFRFLEPRALDFSCIDVSVPYAVKQGSAQFVVLDSAGANDADAPDEQVKAFKAQFDAIGKMKLDHAWLITHKPIWAPVLSKLEDPNSPIISFNQTMQKATKNKLPKSIDLVLAGHLHFFGEFKFADRRATQLVVGHGGALLTPPPYQDPKGIEVAGTTVSEGHTVQDFGFFVMQKAKGGAWKGTAFDRSGNTQLELSY